MRELTQAIHMYGPGERTDKLILLTVAAFCEGDGKLRGWDVEELASLTGLKDMAVKRALNRLAEHGFLFCLGRGAMEHKIFVINRRWLAKRALGRGAVGQIAEWAEELVGVIRFARPERLREARYK